MLRIAHPVQTVKLIRLQTVVWQQQNSNNLKIFPLCCSTHADCLIKECSTINELNGAYSVLKYDSSPSIQGNSNHQPSHYANTKKSFRRVTILELCVQFPICESRKQRKGDCGRATVCCVSETLINGLDSKNRSISAVYCLSDSKNNLVAAGDTTEHYGSLQWTYHPM
jgi:hypothetical protein